MGAMEKRRSRDIAVSCSSTCSRFEARGGNRIQFFSKTTPCTVYDTIELDLAERLKGPARVRTGRSRQRSQGAVRDRKPGKVPDRHDRIALPAGR
jgi:hypothetical protein